MSVSWGSRVSVATRPVRAAVSVVGTTRVYCRVSLGWATPPMMVTAAGVTARVVSVESAGGVAALAQAEVPPLVVAQAALSMTTAGGRLESAVTAKVV